LTAGWLPLSAVLIHEKIYDVFYAAPQLDRNFLHSHTYSGNALAVAVAVEVMAIMEEEKICEKAQALGQSMRSALQAVADKTGGLTNVRGLGAIAAADLIHYQPHSGHLFSQIAAKEGALLRPMGPTLYWLPPLNMALDTLKDLQRITENSIRAYAKIVA
jgi:adenosylmethionine-8-amino-7-oxononanoate aminotransferase